jgi:hypothetical protein
MSDEDLQAQWDAAIAGGDLATLERIGPVLFPEDGAARSAPSSAAPPAPAPAAPARDFEAEANAIRDDMMKPFASPDWQEKLNALYREQYPEPSPAELEARLTPADVRPDLGSSGYRWDDGLVRDFETQAPGGLVLMHIAAEAIRASARWPDLGDALLALEARHGEKEADALLEDALAYQKAHVAPAMLANLRTHGVLYAPDVIRAAAFAWRGHRTEQ